MQGGLWTPEKVAKYLVMDVVTIRTMLRNGDLPGIKIGRMWRVDPDDLKAFIESQKQKTRDSLKKTPVKKRKGRK
jgi:excisionase family DNA binding protein